MGATKKKGMAAAQKSGHAVWQNFDEASEAALNEQINMELYASYAYQAAARHFQRDDVGLHGFAHFFQESSDEEREHAEKFQKYLLMRGGRLALTDVKAPPTEYESGLAAMEAALQLERDVNESILAMHKVANDRFLGGQLPQRTSRRH